MSRHQIKSWFQQGTPWVWLNAGAVSISVIMVVVLLGFIAFKGALHFWPSTVLSAEYSLPDGRVQLVMGEIFDREKVSRGRLLDMGLTPAAEQAYFERWLIKTGNRDIDGKDFSWVLVDKLANLVWPSDVFVIERREWGHFYGFFDTLKDSQTAEILVDSQEGLQQAIKETNDLMQQITDMEKHEMGRINYEMDRLRLQQRKRQLSEVQSKEQIAAQDALIEQQQAALNLEYQVLNDQLAALNLQAGRYQLTLTTVDGQSKTMPLSTVVHAYQPNKMSVLAKCRFYLKKLLEFVVTEPREANTEGGIFPAIFGTVVMVILMSILVTPFGVIAAVYLREYAKQGFVTRLIRIAVNNLAGVPSIVFGVFGLGFLVYGVGGSIDQVFYPEASPAPVFGTPGLLWASLTLALLTVPVVIVSTEEGLARVPKALREGSMALGATKAETLWKVVLPMSSPAMMTGLILAIARAAGEVAPLMLVGVVKLAPNLPVDMNAPFIHLERKFMHLGFHIYDVGFQSPNVEAARPLVYAAAFLLVAIIAGLNVSAIVIRNRLREKYKSLEN